MNSIQYGKVRTCPNGNPYIFMVTAYSMVMKEWGEVDFQIAPKLYIAEDSTEKTADWTIASFLSQLHRSFNRGRGTRRSDVC